MEQFARVTVNAMRTALEEVCRHIPSTSISVRAFVAARILENAPMGERTSDGLTTAGRRAVLDRLGSTDAAMSALSHGASLKA